MAFVDDHKENICFFLGGEKLQWLVLWTSYREEYYSSTSSWPSPLLINLVSDERRVDTLLNVKVISTIYIAALWSTDQQNVWETVRDD